MYNKVKNIQAIPTRLVKDPNLSGRTSNSSSASKNAKNQSEHGTSNSNNSNNNNHLRNTNNKIKYKRTLTNTKKILTERYTSTIYDVSHLTSDTTGEINNFDKILNEALDCLYQSNDKIIDLTAIMANYDEEDPTDFEIPEQIILSTEILLKLRRQATKLQKMKVLGQCNIDNLCLLNKLLDANIRFGIANSTIFLGFWKWVVPFTIYFSATANETFDPQLRLQKYSFPN